MSRGVFARHETGPTGSAVGGVCIGVHEDHAVLGQLVDVGTLVESRSREGQVGPAKVVDEEKDDVRLAGIGLPEEGEYGRSENDEETGFHTTMTITSSRRVKRGREVAQLFEEEQGSPSS